MRYKVLGKTGLSVSVATVGTWAIGGSGWGAVDRNDSIRAIRSMLDNEVNIVDTAPIYGCGVSEEIVGEAIKGYDREKLIVSTKCGLVWGEGAPKGGRDISGKSIMKEIDDSLRRLGVEYIDIYHVHKPD
ncbi:MAG: aldo/keto reductase, partial [Hominenteromicrobium sp.]